MEYKEYRSCGRKIPYAEKQAKKQIKHSWKEQLVRLYAYRCKYCKQWHLTKQEQQVNKPEETVKVHREILSLGSRPEPIISVHKGLKRHKVRVKIIGQISRKTI